MSADLPEGVDLDTVREHAMHLSLVAKTINLVSDHGEAEACSLAEHEAEMALDDHVEQILNLGPGAVGGVILALAAVLVVTGDEATVQAYFDEQAENVRRVLNG